MERGTQRSERMWSHIVSEKALQLIAAADQAAELNGLEPVQREELRRAMVLEGLKREGFTPTKFPYIRDYLKHR